MAHITWRAAARSIVNENWGNEHADTSEAVKAMSDGKKLVGLMALAVGRLDEIARKLDSIDRGVGVEGMERETESKRRSAIWGEWETDGKGSRMSAPFRRVALDDSLPFIDWNVTKERLTKLRMVGPVTADGAIKFAIENGLRAKGLED